MKNFLRICIPLLLLAALSLSAAALRPGDVAGQVLATDIRAFIDGVEIPAYNIDGNLGVVAEDLNAYGFVTGYDNPTRTLNVARTGAAVRGDPREQPPAERHGHRARAVFRHPRLSRRARDPRL